MPTKKQRTPAVVINARIDYMSKGPGLMFDHYIVIVHGGQEFIGTKSYRFHANAVRFAKKMGFNVPVDGLDELMGE